MSDQQEPLAALVAQMREALVEILDRTNREKARDYEAALNGGILEIHDIANTALSAPPEPPSNSAALREALKRILAIEGYGAPWIEAKCIAQKALEGEQYTPPLAQERPKIEQPGNAAAMREALIALVKYWDWGGFDALRESKLKDTARAALAAPARNCDRFADCNPAWKAYNAIADRERLLGFDFWLFAPAKEVN